MSSEDLAAHGRIMDLSEEVEGLIPFVWNNQVHQSFVTFEDCIRYWYAYDSTSMTGNS